MTRYTDTFTDMPQSFVLPTSDMDVRKMWCFTAISKRCHIPRSTLKSAADEGLLRSYYTGCGLRLTTLQDVWDWQQTRKFKGQVDGIGN